MSSGSGPRAASQAGATQHERFSAEREHLLRAQRAGSAPGHADLVAVALLVSCALGAALWLVGTPPADGPVSSAMLVGGLLGSGSVALMSAGRPSPWWPLPGSWWVWRLAVLSGPLAAQAIYVGLIELLDVLPATQSDRLLLGFVAGVAIWRFVRPARLVAVAPEPVPWR